MKSPQSITEGIGERLRSFRRSLSMTQQQLGDVIGKTASQISELERENSNITVFALAVFIKELNLNPYWFLFGLGSPIREEKQPTPENQEISTLTQRIEKLEEQVNVLMNR